LAARPLIASAADVPFMFDAGRDRVRRPAAG
jgi:hypothetical protein